MVEYPYVAPACSLGSRFELNMLLEFSGGTAKPDPVALPAPPGAPLPVPPTGPPEPYSLLGGRFWFSPLEDWVSNQSIQLFRYCVLPKLRQQKEIT